VQFLFTFEKGSKLEWKKIREDERLLDCEDIVERPLEEL
jgi:hypothetical protein